MLQLAILANKINYRQTSNISPMQWSLLCGYRVLRQELYISIVPENIPQGKHYTMRNITFGGATLSDIKVMSAHAVGKDSLHQVRYTVILTLDNIRCNLSRNGIHHCLESVSANVALSQYLTLHASYRTRRVVGLFVRRQAITMRWDHYLALQAL